MQYKSQCPSEFCSATNPSIEDLTKNDIPRFLQKRTKSNIIKRCSYCGTIWVEEVNEKINQFNTNKNILGTRNIHSGKTDWIK